MRRHKKFEPYLGYLGDVHWSQPGLLFTVTRMKEVIFLWSKNLIDLMNIQDESPAANQAQESGNDKALVSSAGANMDLLM